MKAMKACCAGEYSNHNIGYTERKAQHDWRKRCADEEVRVENWHQREKKVRTCEIPDAQNHDNEDGVIDVIKVEKCAGDEQEDGEMNITHQSLMSHEKVPLVGTIGNESANPCSLLWTAWWVPDEFDVSACPFLLRCRHDSAGKTDKQAQEPEGVHPDGVSRRREHGWLCQSGRNRRVRNIRVGEELIDAREIERRCILRVGLEVLQRH